MRNSIAILLSSQTRFFTAGAWRWSAIGRSAKRALLVQSGLMTTTDVVQQGYSALMQGKTVVIPGLSNKIGALATRFVPRQMTVRLVRRMQERTGH